MDRLWSPWRYQYVSKASPADACIFCRMSSEAADEQNLVLHRAERNLIVLNRFPYTSGHLMVAPYEHVATLEEAADETVREMMSLTRWAQRCVGAAYRPHGYNLGMNLGESAGAGVAGHIHMHLLPRWRGDVNFMTAVGETRVLPEDLAATYRKLHPLFQTK